MLTRSSGVKLAATVSVWALVVAAQASPPNWPSFRGPRASGVADGQNPPTAWDAEKGINIRWKTPIPGLGHSSPIVWGERVFVTSAVNSADPEPYLRIGLYGESPENPENSVHHYRLYCLDKRDGKIIWEQTAHSGIPQVKRHIKSSHANPTPATDGKHVVAFFGSEGLYCFDLDGKPLWKQELGYLDAGAFDAPEIQWGFGSSPIIHDEMVVVLCDVNNQSFIVAFDVDSGKEIWRTLREEVPTWGTPAVCEVDGLPQVIVNGWKHIGAYDLKTGAEIWRMRGGGDIPVPTPIVAHGLVFITNAHGPLSPIYAIRPGARGDISLSDGERSNQFVAWSEPRRGAYIPTPIVYDDYLYIGNDRGVLTCYRATTGEQVYRKRIAGRRGAFSASPVAADGRLYFTDEHGEIHVVKAGAEYEHLSTNQMGEPCLATPAISDQMLFVRTSKHLYGIGRSGEQLASAETDARPEPTVEDDTDSRAPTAQTRDEPARAGGELTDPVEILKRVDAAAEAVTTVKYNVVLEGTGPAKAQVGSLKAAVVAAGFADGLPERFIVEAEALTPGSTQPVRVTGGSDGDIYFVIDHQNKKAHVDLELRVMGSFARPILNGVMREFHVPTPFGDEINAKKQELRGSKQIGGEECYEVHVVYAGERAAESTWYFSKKDFLPRARHYWFTTSSGEKGGALVTLTDVIVDPQLPPDAFKLKLPPAYTQTDEFAP
jgi:outer membrane protein assembly factor BamB